MIIIIFKHTGKWYTQNPESVLEKETRKLLGDFEIQMDHLILARRPDIEIINQEREFAELRTPLSRLTTG